MYLRVMVGSCGPGQLVKHREAQHFSDIGEGAPKAAEVQPQGGGVPSAMKLGDPTRSFFAYPSNVDAHNYDFFRNNEIQECPSNIEYMQAHRVRRTRECDGICRF